MSGDWHMNALRLPISNWIYATDATHYLNLLDRVVQQANQAGLYVILDLHDDSQSGSPYGTGASVPKTERVAFWRIIASRYRSYPLVLFDCL
jgi:aryl-phospho-beta-D-glucosidase BglC (GH1 family)